MLEVGILILILEFGYLYLYWNGDNYINNSVGILILILEWWYWCLYWIGYIFTNIGVVILSLIVCLHIAYIITTLMILLLLNQAKVRFLLKPFSLVHSLYLSNKLNLNKLVLIILTNYSSFFLAKAFSTVFVTVNIKW